MNKIWYMMNAVYYDGCNAYVSKFIGQVETNKDTVKTLDSTLFEVTEETRKKIIGYLNGNGEILKIDPLYPVTFENIVALQNHPNAEEQAAYERFKEMWF